jgi:hypothetical protein
MYLISLSRQAVIRGNSRLRTAKQAGLSDCHAQDTDKADFGKGIGCSSREIRGYTQLSGERA